MSISNNTNMEAKKNTKEESQSKLTYEQLNQMAGDLYQQNQKLVAKINQLQSALDDTEFNKLSFFISMLFKVIEHPDSYKSEFVAWCVENIESALTGFAETYYNSHKPGVADEKADGVNEA